MLHELRSCGYVFIVRCWLVVILGIVASRKALTVSFFSNLGWVELNQGLLVMPASSRPAALKTAMGWFTLAEQRKVTQYSSKYGQQMATVAMLNSSSPFPTFDWQVSRADSRQHVHLWVILKMVISFTEQATILGLDVQEASWRAVLGEVGEVLIRYESHAIVPYLSWEEILRRIAVGQEARRLDHVAYWESQIRQRYPGEGFRWLHDFQNPYAQIALAKAYADLGLIEEAISVGEQAMASHHWHWGHYVVADLYRRQGRFIEVENHLKQAVKYGGGEEIVARYRVELAEMYIDLGKTSLAQDQLCRVVGNEDVTGSDDAWWRKAIAALSQISNLSETGANSVCH